MRCPEVLNGAQPTGVSSWTSNLRRRSLTPPAGVWRISVDAQNGIGAFGPPPKNTRTVARIQALPPTVARAPTGEITQKAQTAESTSRQIRTAPREPRTGASPRCASASNAPSTSSTALRPERDHWVAYWSALEEAAPESCRRIDPAEQHLSVYLNASGERCHDTEQLVRPATHYFRACALAASSSCISAGRWSVGARASACVEARSPLRVWPAR